MLRIYSCGEYLQLRRVLWRSACVTPETNMVDFKRSQYGNTGAETRASSSFQALKSLYDLADNALRVLAENASHLEEADRLEDKFLADKDALIRMASDIQCQNRQEVFDKIDFMSHIYLEEKTASDFGPEDMLLKSIYEDCQSCL